MEVDIKPKGPARHGPHITSHDLLKTLALIFMMIDHAGYYFYPQEAWFRIWGRFSAPVWFFLVGYADKRKVQAGIWIGAFLLLACWAVTGQYIFPLNILFALALTRLVIDQVMVRALKNRESFWGMFLLLFFTSFLTIVVVEYGTLGIMFAVFGYIRRHKDQIRIGPFMLFAYVVAAACSLIVIQLALLPAPSKDQLIVLFSGMGAVCIALYFFRPVAFPRLSRYALPLVPLIRFLGRRSLEIYVIHLLLLAGIITLTDPGRFGLFQVHWVPPALTQLFL
jgi:hypothetical protein